jgi:hypothetical protein
MLLYDYQIFALEPLAPYYLRRAESYRFIHRVLEEAFDEGGLGNMRRMTADGPSNLLLHNELKLLQNIFHGAYLMVCDELGMAPDSSKEGNDKGREVFRMWVASVEQDPELSRDVRMMVPVFYDVQRKQMKVWTVLGLAAKKLRVSFAKPPDIKAAVDESGHKLEPGEIYYQSVEHRLAYFVTGEVYVNCLLDRREFRKHCDQYKTAEAIRRNLK